MTNCSGLRDKGRFTVSSDGDFRYVVVDVGTVADSEWLAVVIGDFDTHAGSCSASAANVAYGQQVWVAGNGVTVETQAVITGITFFQRDLESFRSGFRTHGWESRSWVSTQVNFFILSIASYLAGRLFDFTGEFNSAVCCHCVGSSCRQYQGSQRQ